MSALSWLLRLVGMVSLLLSSLISDTPNIPRSVAVSIMFDQWFYGWALIALAGILDRLDKRAPAGADREG